MHIPDGILSPVVWTSTAIISTLILAKSVQYSKQNLQQRAVPVMGAMAAFIFAAQMVNFPLLGAAASGHLIGGALSAILFGFWPATLIMTTVVVIQAVLFQDGGITALGANILNMAIVTPAIGAIVYYGLQKFKVPLSISAFLAAWLSVVGISILGAFQLSLSEVIPFATAAPALIFWHMMVGIGEGLITAIVIPIALRSAFHRVNQGGVTTYE
jgi:cobalt/nickel transport system permease protein